MVSGIVGDYDRHVGGLRAALIAAELDWDDAWKAMADDDSGKTYAPHPRRRPTPPERCAATSHVLMEINARLIIILLAALIGQQPKHGERECGQLFLLKLLQAQPFAGDRQQVH